MIYKRILCYIRENDKEFFKGVKHPFKLVKNFSDLKHKIKWNDMVVISASLVNEGFVYKFINNYFGYNFFLFRERIYDYFIDGLPPETSIQKIVKKHGPQQNYIWTIPSILAEFYHKDYPKNSKERKVLSQLYLNDTL